MQLPRLAACLALASTAGAAVASTSVVMPFTISMDAQQVGQGSASPGTAVGTGTLTNTDGRWAFDWKLTAAGFTNPDGTPDALTRVTVFDTAPLAPRPALQDVDLTAFGHPTYAVQPLKMQGGFVSVTPDILQADLLSRSVCMDIKTTSYPGAAVHGCFVPVPEPGSMALLAVSLPAALLGLTRGRRRGCTHSE